MIEYRDGDILASEADALVNTVNCVGVMGRGIALQFKNAFPDNYKAYSKACDRHEVRPGHMFIFPTGNLVNPRYIVNFPTKRHWKEKSRMEDIEAGLMDLADQIQSLGITSIAIPPLGCGLGGLVWADVKNRLDRALGPIREVQFFIYEAGKAGSNPKNHLSVGTVRLSPGRAALIGLMDRYLGGLLDPFITLLEIHKLMYFLQVAGEPLQLEYKKEFYDPYVTNLRHVLRHLEGHYLTGYQDGGDAPDKKLSLMPGSREGALSYLEQQKETVARMQRVQDLVDGFESPFGLELLATIHWVVDREKPTSLDQVEEKTYAWNPAKKQFTSRQIRLAAEVLAQKGWISLPG